MMCIFCKIVEGTAPSYKVYEDEHTFAFLDINPVTDGHVLAVPRLHEPFVENLPMEIHDALFATIRKLVKPVQDSMGAPASNIIINNGPNAGQIVPHVHVHIIPRPKRISGNFFSNVARVRPRKKEYFEKIADRIRKEIG